MDRINNNAFTSTWLSETKQQFCSNYYKEAWRLTQSSNSITSNTVRAFLENGLSEVSSRIIDLLITTTPFTVSIFFYILSWKYKLHLYLNTKPIMLTKTTVSTIFPHIFSGRYKLHVYLNRASSDTLPTLTSNRMKTSLSPLHCCLTLNASQLQTSHQGEYQGKSQVIKSQVRVRFTWGKNDHISCTYI